MTLIHALYLIASLLGLLLIGGLVSDTMTRIKQDDS